MNGASNNVEVSFLLPDDILRIIANLSDLVTWVSLRRCSRKFHNVCGEPDIVRSLCFSPIYRGGLSSDGGMCSALVESGLAVDVCHLDASSIVRACPYSLARWIHAFPNLHTLLFPSSVRFPLYCCNDAAAKARWMHTFFYYSKPPIERLTLSDAQLSPESMAIVAHFLNKTLVFLDIKETCVPDGVLEAVSLLTSLQVLIMDDCHGSTTEGLVKMLISLGSSLRKISLNRNYHIDDRFFTGLLSVKNLQSLTLQECNRLTSTGLQYFLQNIDDHCHHLQVLNLNGCMWVDDDVLRLFGTYAPKLQMIQSLHLRGCSVSSAGLHYLRFLPHLSDLDVSYTQVDDGALFAISGIPRLKTLSLNNCQNSYEYFGLEGLRALSQAELLSTLELRSNRQLDDDCLRVIAENLLNLRDIDLTSPLSRHRFTEAALGAMKERFRQRGAAINCKTSF